MARFGNGESRRDRLRLQSGTPLPVLSPVLARVAAQTFLDLVLLAPLVLRFLRPERGGFWHELAVLTGLAATSSLICTLILPSRLKFLSRTFGVNGLLGSHRFFGIATLGLVLLHLVAVIAVNPANVTLINILIAPSRAVSATIAAAALVVLVALAILRQRFRRRYELWRRAHIALTLAALALVVSHIWFLRSLVFDPYWLTLFGLLFGFAALTLGYRWLWKPVVVDSSRFTVADMWYETPTVLTIAATRDDIPAFKAGQFAWVRLRRSLAAEDHPFTIASPPGIDEVLFSVRTTGDWTGGALAHLRPGMPIWVDMAYGGMTLDPDAHSFIMIANGVGLTPMMSMLRSMELDHDPRHVWLIIAGHDPLFRTQLDGHAQTLNLHIIGLTEPMSPTVLDRILPDQFYRSQSVYYICGSPLLIEDTTTALHRMGISAGRVRTEQFDSA